MLGMEKGFEWYEERKGIERKRREEQYGAASNIHQTLVT
jgi:hypothetical protein